MHNKQAKQKENVTTRQKIQDHTRSQIFFVLLLGRRVWEVSWGCQPDVPLRWRNLPDLPLTEDDLRNFPLQLNCREKNLLNTPSLNSTQIFERNTTFLVYPSFFLAHREKK